MLFFSRLKSLFTRFKKDEPTATQADNRLSLVLSYQRSDINEDKLKQFQAKLVDLCTDFGYDVVGQVLVVPQSQDRTTVISASIPIRRKEKA